MITIRRAKIRDAEVLAKLAMEMMKQHGKYDPVFEVKKDAEKKFLEWFKKIPRDSRSLLLVAESKGQIIGYAKANIKRRPPIYKIGKMGFIHDIFVHKDFRRQGIGKKLINEVFSWLKKKGVRYADLFVATENDTAITVYKNMGFRGFMMEKYREI